MCVCVCLLTVQFYLSVFFVLFVCFICVMTIDGLQICFFLYLGTNMCVCVCWPRIFICLFSLCVDHGINLFVCLLACALNVEFICLLVCVFYLFVDREILFVLFFGFILCFGCLRIGCEIYLFLCLLACALTVEYMNLFVCVFVCLLTVEFYLFCFLGFLLCFGCLRVAVKFTCFFVCLLVLWLWNLFVCLFVGRVILFVLFFGFLFCFGCLRVGCTIHLFCLFCFGMYVIGWGHIRFISEGW